MTNLYESIGITGVLRSALAIRHITTQQLAADCGMSASAMRRRLRGEVEFRTGELTRVAEVLGLNAGDLIAASGELRASPQGSIETLAS